MDSAVVRPHTLRRRRTRGVRMGGGIAVFGGLMLGFTGGVLVGQAMLGVVIGLGAGLLGAAAIGAWDRRRTGRTRRP